MKIQILDTMKTERLGNRLWGLLSEFRVLIDGDLFTIPSSFVTDGASTKIKQTTRSRRTFYLVSPWWLLIPDVGLPIQSSSVFPQLQIVHKSRQALSLVS